MDYDLILWLVLGLNQVLIVLYAWLWEQRKRRRVIFQCRASILSKRTEPRTLKTASGSVDYDWYYVTFRINDEKMLLLSVTDAVWSLPLGTEGSLIYGDGRCESFLPD